MKEKKLSKNVNWKTEIATVLKIQKSVSSLELKKILAEKLKVKIACPGPYYVALNALIATNRIVKKDNKYEISSDFSSRRTRSDRNDIEEATAIIADARSVNYKRNGVPVNTAIASFHTLSKVLDKNYRKKDDVSLRAVDMEREDNITSESYKSRAQVNRISTSQRIMQPTLEEMMMKISSFHRNIDFRQILKDYRKLVRRYKTIFSESDYLPAGQTRPSLQTIHRLALMKAVRLRFEPFLHQQLSTVTDSNMSHKKYDFTTVKKWHKSILNKSIRHYVKGRQALRKDPGSNTHCSLPNCDALIARVSNVESMTYKHGSFLNFHKIHWLAVHFALFSSKCLHCGRTYRKMAQHGILEKGVQNGQRYVNKALQQIQHSIKYHLPKSLWPYECGVCNEKLVTRPNVVQHIKYKHLDNQVQCPIQG